MPLNTRQHAGVREIRFSNPPVNALSVRSGLCRELTEAITAALADAAVDSIIVAGDGANFSAGADIGDFAGEPQSLNILRGLQNRIEQAGKPIVMAIRGLCLGGGLELALAGHYRVASAEAQFGLPEVTLGLLPGGGGTQRLPRLIGASRSLQMMLSGKAMRSNEALAVGLIDGVCDGDPVEHALQFIASGRARAVRRTGALAVPADLGTAIAAARTEAVSLASKQILAAASAALTSDLNSALATEARLFAELMASEPSRALRHVFFGQRAVTRLPAGLEATPKTINKVSIVGGGLMGTGIAIALLKAGLKIQLVEPRNDARDRAASAVATTLQRDVDKGRLTPRGAHQATGEFCYPCAPRGRERSGPLYRGRLRGYGCEAGDFPCAGPYSRLGSHSGQQYFCARFEPTRSSDLPAPGCRGAALLQPCQHHATGGDHPRHSDLACDFGDRHGLQQAHR